MDPEGVIIGIVGSTILGLIAIALFASLQPLAPEQGEPMYQSWQSLTVSLETIIPMIAGGTIAAVALVVGMLKEGF